MPPLPEAQALRENRCKRDTDAVTQPLAHYLGMNALLKHKAGVGMAKVMEPEAG